MCVCVCLSLQSLFFKLRSTTPCCLNHLSFDVDLPEDDEIQVCNGGISEELVRLRYRDMCGAGHFVTFISLNMLEFRHISWKILEYEPIFHAVFLPCLYLCCPLIIVTYLLLLF